MAPINAQAWRKQLGHWMSGILLAMLCCCPKDSLADDRHFGYSYESGVLAKDNRELELWNTWRYGRSKYFSRIDHRVEFEVGLTDKLQTAFYVNFQVKQSNWQTINEPLRLNIRAFRLNGSTN